MSRAEERGVFLGGLLFLLVLIAYVPVMRNGYVWDDDSYLTTNKLITQSGGLGTIWTQPPASPQYYPLVFTSFWIEHAIWGLRPAGYHFVNVMLHGAGALLLWRLLKGLSIPGAWLAAAMFGLHPIQVESVAWITERKNVLSGVFYFAAMLAYGRFRAFDRSREASQLENSLGKEVNSTDDWRFWALSLLLFVAALLSKSVTATLPVAVLILTWWKRGRLRWNDALPLIPFFVLGAASGTMTSHLEQEHVGVSKIAELQLTPIERILIAGRASWFYLGKIVWPTRLTFSYPRWAIDMHSATQYLFPLAVIAVLALLWRARERWGPGPMAGALYFGATLAPALGFVSVYPMRFSFVADHFAYLATVGPFTLIAAGVVQLSRAVRARMGRSDCPSLSLPHGVFLIGILSTLLVMTWRQCTNYRDAETLWKDTIAKNPSSWMAYGNLAKDVFDKGRVSESIGYSKKALALKWNAPHIHQNLGWAYYTLGNYPDAIRSYQEALRQLPNFDPCRFNLALALRATNQPDQAMNVLRASSHDGNAEYQMGQIRAAQKRDNDAIEHFRRATKLRPEFAPAWNDLGVLLTLQGQTMEALDCFEKAVRCKPDFAEAVCHLGQGLARVGKTSEAIKILERGVTLNPNHTEARAALGNLLLSQRQFDEAAFQFEQILRLDPHDAAATAGLSAAREKRTTTQSVDK